MGKIKNFAHELDPFFTTPSLNNVNFLFFCAYIELQIAQNLRPVSPLSTVNYKFVSICYQFTNKRVYTSIKFWIKRTDKYSNTCPKLTPTFHIQAFYFEYFKVALPHPFKQSVSHTVHFNFLKTFFRVCVCVCFSFTYCVNALPNTQLSWKK